jgi:Lipid A 3-O-deacylase (PagL)
VYASKRFDFIENCRKSIRTLLKLGKREFAGRASRIGSVVLCLAPLFCAVSAFPQAVVAIDGANWLGENDMRQIRERQTFVVPTFNGFEYFAEPAATSAQATRDPQMSDVEARGSPAPAGNPGEGSNVLPSVERPPVSKPADFNRDIYYRNKLEFSLDGGWLPINVPFPLDVFVGDTYNTYPLKYTLVPIFASLRWHMGGVSGPLILRGNFDLTFAGSVTAIPRGPESRYFSYLMGIRRNFVPRNWRAAPYFDVRLGVGNIDAKGPQGVLYAQGQDLTFTVNMGSGVRYNFSPRYSLSAGLNFMHISNLDLSEGNGKPNWGVRNYGINVYGPMVGIDIQLRRHFRDGQQ